MMAGLLPEWHPLTFVWAALEIDFDCAADFFRNWRRDTALRVSRRDLTGPLTEMLAH